MSSCNLPYFKENGAHVYVTRGERSNRVYECIGIVGSIIVADEPEGIETGVAKGRPLMQQRRTTPASFWSEMLRIKMSHAAAVLNGKSRRASWIEVKNKFPRLEVISRPIYALVEIRAATCSLSLHGQTFRIGWLNGSTGDVQSNCQSAPPSLQVGHRSRMNSKFIVD